MTYYVRILCFLPKNAGRGMRDMGYRVEGWIAGVVDLAGRSRRKDKN